MCIELARYGVEFRSRQRNTANQPVSEDFGVATRPGFGRPNFNALTTQIGLGHRPGVTLNILRLNS